jgi:hypothetical protein
MLIELQKSFPSLIVIDFTDIICNKEECFSSLQNTSLYRDQQHLTYEGSSILGKIYLQKHVILFCKVIKLKKKILFITRNLPPLIGGMERLNWHIIDELSKDYDVLLISHS